MTGRRMGACDRVMKGNKTRHMILGTAHKIEMTASEDYYNTKR